MPDHQMQITISTDGGHTFVAATNHDLGTTGSFVKEVKRTRMGQNKQYCFRLSVSSPIKCPILAAALQVETSDG